MRDNPGRRESAALVLGREPDPQVPVFLAQREASEEPRAHEARQETQDDYHDQQLDQ